MNESPRAVACVSTDRFFFCVTGRVSHDQVSHALAAPFSKGLTRRRPLAFSPAQGARFPRLSSPLTPAAMRLHSLKPNGPTSRLHNPEG